MSKNIEVIKKIYDMLDKEENLVDREKINFIVSRLPIEERKALMEAGYTVPKFDEKTGIKEIGNIKEFQKELEKQGYYLDYNTSKNLFLTYIAGRRTGRGRPIPTSMFTGIPGSGKTSLAETFARITGSTELYLQCVNGIDKDTFQKSANIKAIIEGDSENAYQLGILCRAIEESKKQPTTLIIDEADKTTPEIDSMFYDFIENGRVTLGTEEYEKGEFPLYIFFTSNGERKFDQTFLSRCKMNEIPRLSREQFLQKLGLEDESYFGYIYDKVPNFTLRQARMYLQDLKQLQQLHPEYKGMNLDELFNVDLLSQYVDPDELEVRSLNDVKSAKKFLALVEEKELSSLMIDISAVTNVLEAVSDGIRCVQGEDGEKKLRIENLEQLQALLNSDNINNDWYYGEEKEECINERIGEGGWIQIPFLDEEKIIWCDEKIGHKKLGIKRTGEENTGEEKFLKFVIDEKDGIESMLFYVEDVTDVQRVQEILQMENPSKEYTMQREAKKDPEITRDKNSKDISSAGVQSQIELLSLIDQLDVAQEDVMQEVSGIKKSLKVQLAEKGISYQNNRLMRPVISVDEVKKRFKEKNYYLDDDMAEKIAVYYNVGVNDIQSGVEAMKLSGVAGGGKTSLSEVFAEVFETEKFVLQCTDGMGLDNFQLTTNLEGVMKKDSQEALKKGILLRAIEASQERPVTLLIDELDKTTPDVDSFLLDFIEKGRVSLGTEEYIKGDFPIYLMFTSNNKRKISEPLESRSRDVEVPRLKKELFLERLGLPKDHYLGEVYDRDKNFTLRQAIPYMEGLRDLKAYDPDYADIDLNTYIDESIYQYLTVEGSELKSREELEKLKVGENREKVTDRERFSLRIWDTIDEDDPEYSTLDYLTDNEGWELKYNNRGFRSIDLNSIEEWKRFEESYYTACGKWENVSASVNLKVPKEQKVVEVYTEDGKEKTNEVILVRKGKSIDDEGVECTTINNYVGERLPDGEVIVKLENISGDELMDILIDFGISRDRGGDGRDLSDNPNPNDDHDYI
ncbi:MAG: AAA family ATPase [Clostridia bacterium]|nr:AAA family ATPase [Clostridia bacterium]